MTGRFNQDLPENLQMTFEKATNFEPQIITKQSINNRKVHEVSHINITHGEDEVAINEAHVRNLNYKGKNYDPNYQQNRTKMTNNHQHCIGSPILWNPGLRIQQNQPTGETS